MVLPRVHMYESKCNLPLRERKSWSYRESTCMNLSVTCPYEKNITSAICVIFSRGTCYWWLVAAEWSRTLWLWCLAIGDWLQQNEAEHYDCGVWLLVIGCSRMKQNTMIAVFGYWWLVAAERKQSTMIVVFGFWQNMQHLLLCNVMDTAWSAFTLHTLHCSNSTSPTCVPGTGIAP